MVAWRKEISPRRLFTVGNREFKIRRPRTTATDKHVTAHDQNRK